MTIRNSLPFAVIPEWLLDAEVGHAAVRLYGVLVRYADKEHHAHPSRRTLAKRLRCSPDTIDRALKELVDIGAVDVENRRDEAGDLTTNDYILRPGGRMGAATGSRTGDATVAAPMRHRTRAIEREPLEREKTLAATPQNGAPSNKSTRAKAEPKPRARDPIWDVFVDIYGEPMPANRAAWNRAAKDLREAGADPVGLRAFVAGVENTGTHWAAVTPMAVAKHYGQRARLTRVVSLESEAARKLGWDL